jgi:hypothetical protein
MGITIEKLWPDKSTNQLGGTDEMQSNEN